LNQKFEKEFNACFNIPQLFDEFIRDELSDISKNLNEQFDDIDVIEGNLNLNKVF
jgi:hypothetical protein